MDDPYAFELDTMRYMMRVNYSIGRFKTRKRPSWLHPYRRIMWVHVHGPHVPEVKVLLPDLRRRGMGVLTGVTS